MVYANLDGRLTYRDSSQGHLSYGAVPDPLRESSLHAQSCRAVILQTLQSSLATVAVACSNDNPHKLVLPRDTSPFLE